MNASANADAGFSLVEMLVSLAILAATSLTLAMGLGDGAMAWRRVDAGAHAAEDAQGAQQALRDRIEKAYPAVQFGGDGPTVDFDGEPTSLQFLAPAPEADGPHALRRYTLMVDPAGELILSSIPDLAVRPPPPASQTVLLRHVQDVQFDYFGAVAPGGDAQWNARWSGVSRPPQLVRVRLDLPPGDARPWPPLVVQVTANVDNACVLNIATGACKAQ